MIHSHVDTNLGLRPLFDVWHTARYPLRLERPLVMGIVNVTPDSFSNIAKPELTKMAIDEAQRLLNEGADIIDIGGESTRPGAQPLTADQEWERIAPVLREVVSWNIPISVDTYHAQTMRRALDLGVDIINDVWALQQANAMSVIQGYTCGICLMHMHGEPLTMQLKPMQGKVLPQVLNFFHARLQLLQEAGIQRQRVVIDPGIGFGKTVEQNFQLLALQNQLLELSLPVMVGWSRKSSLGAVTGLDVHHRMVPSVVAAVLAAERGASIVRVHDVAQTVSALAVWSAAKHH